ncbi:MAG: Ldh family oxidoreductase [Candidatus Methylomirabilales bacterium]
MPAVTPDRLKAAITEVLRGLGAAEDEACIVAESLVRAEMRGTDTHGLPYLKLLVERAEARMVSLPTRLTTLRDEGATALLDGGNGIGQFAGWTAMATSVRKARELGVGLTLVRNTNNLGFLAFYTMHAAEQGLVGVAMSNANASVSPWGGAEAYLGTNPMSISVPGTAEPLVLDMSSSVVARGKIRKAHRLGEKIPPGWALDEFGAPTEDPAAALKGTLLPIGGPKGYGLALMVDVLAGMLSGSAFGRQVKSFHELAGPTGVGALLLAFEVERFMPLETFRTLMAGYVTAIRGSRRARGTVRIYTPGEIESEKEQASRERGIELADASVEMLNQYLEKLRSPLRL